MLYLFTCLLPVQGECFLCIDDDGCLLQCELSGRSVPRPGVDHVEFHHIPPSPCSRESHRRGSGHQQETQLAGVTAEKEEARLVFRSLLVTNSLKKDNY